jgi:hypothetical protein
MKRRKTILTAGVAVRPWDDEGTSVRLQADGSTLVTSEPGRGRHRGVFAHARRSGGRSRPGWARPTHGSTV